MKGKTIKLLEKKKKAWKNHLMTLQKQALGVPSQGGKRKHPHGWEHWHQWSELKQVGRVAVHGTGWCMVSEAGRP